MTRKWNIVSDQSNANCNIKIEIIHNMKVLKSNLCDCNDAYILVKVEITIIGHAATQVPFKHFALFIKCITKFDGTKPDDAEHFDLIRVIYNLL